MGKCISKSIKEDEESTTHQVKDKPKSRDIEIQLEYEPDEYIEDPYTHNDQLHPSNMKYYVNKDGDVISSKSTSMILKEEFGDEGGGNNEFNYKKKRDVTPYINKKNNVMRNNSIRKFFEPLR